LRSKYLKVTKFAAISIAHACAIGEMRPATTIETVKIRKGVLLYFKPYPFLPENTNGRNWRVH
jgi:hypothetical protein